MKKHLFLVVTIVTIVSHPALGQITGKTSPGSFGAAPPVLKMEVSFSEPSGNNALDAGERGQIKVIVANTGMGAAKNALVKLTAGSPLSALQYSPSLSAGDIAPNSTKVVTFELSAPENIPTQTARFTVEVSDEAGIKAEPKSITVSTKERVIADTMPPEIILTKPVEFVLRGMRPLTHTTETKTTAASITIEGIAKDSSGIASLLINGSEARLNLSAEGAQFNHTTTLLIGENRLEIAALDGNKNENRLTLLVRREEPLIAGQNYGLLFGVNSYDSWDPLTNPISDARAIADELGRFYGFEVDLVEDATQQQIVSSLRRYAARKYDQNDQLFIFFAGHGQFDEVLGDGYLVARDSRLRDETRTSYVSHSNLRTIINNIPCKHIFLVVDACYGGTFDPLIALRGEDEYTEVTKAEFIQRKMRFKTRRYLTSGGKEYVSDGRPGQHSPFTRKLLEAFRSYGGKDGLLTINRILQYVEKVKPEPRAGEFGTNEPGSDFIFIAR